MIEHVFDDSAALPPRAESSFEAELRRLLDGLAPVTMRAVPGGTVVGLAEGFRWHGGGPGRPGGPAPDAGDDADDGLLPGALAWDARFAAGTAALGLGRPGPPAWATWPACAVTTTGCATRHRAGR